MKILHLITTISIGGAERQLLLVSSEQTQRGNQVYVAYLKDSPDLAREFSLKGITVFHHLAGKPILKQVKLLRRLISDKNFDIIHLHLPRAEVVGAVASFPKRYFISRHNTETFIPNRLKFIGRILSLVISRRAILVIAISKAVKRFMIEEKELSAAHKIRVIHYGIEGSIRRRNEETKVVSKTPLEYGTLSRLVPQKNLDCMIKAFFSSNVMHSGHKLKIAGSGYLESDLRELARGLDCDKSVSFVGKVIAEPFLDSLDCFVLSSRYEVSNVLQLSSLFKRSVNPIFREELRNEGRRIVSDFSLEKSIDLLDDAYRVR